MFHAAKATFQAAELRFNVSMFQSGSLEYPEEPDCPKAQKAVGQGSILETLSTAYLPLRKGNARVAEVQSLLYSQYTLFLGEEADIEETILVHELS